MANRTYEADPERCQGRTQAGQCTSKSMEGSDYCGAHGGHLAAAHAKKKSFNNYRLTKFHAQLEEHSASANIKSLRDEIGILRMIMQERLNACEGISDLIIQSAPISEMVMKIEKVVSSCHKLEGSMGELLDRSQLLRFAATVIDIIASSIDDPKIVESIASRITEAVNPHLTDE